MAPRHGHSSTPEYTAWTDMLARCGHGSGAGHKDYAGRGIKVCERWRASFLDFLADMGPRPGRGYSIDREDNDGDYEPGNCRWATRTAQVRNTRVVRQIEYQGRIWVFNDLAEAHGIKPATLNARLKKGMSLDDALARPVVSVERHGPDDRPPQDGVHWPTTSIMRGARRVWR